MTTPSRRQPDRSAETEPGPAVLCIPSTSSAGRRTCGWIRLRERYCAIAEHAAEIDDPVVALRDCVLDTCALQATNRGLADLLASLRPLSPHVEELRLRHHRAISTVFTRAVLGGRVHADASPVDLAVLLIANAGLIHRTADHAPGASSRLVGLWLAGIVGPDEPIEVPPAPTDPEIRRALHN